MQYLGPNSKMTEWFQFISKVKELNITAIQVYAWTTNEDEAEAEQFCEDLQHILELTGKKEKMSFETLGTRMKKQGVKRYLE